MTDVKGHMTVCPFFFAEDLENPPCLTFFHAKRDSAYGILRQSGLASVVAIRTGQLKLESEISISCRFEQKE
jgi:hypothetical protein